MALPPKRHPRSVQVTTKAASVPPPAGKVSIPPPPRARKPAPWEQLQRWADAIAYLGHHDPKVQEVAQAISKTTYLLVKVMKLTGYSWRESLAVLQDYWSKERTPVRPTEEAQDPEITQTKASRITAWYRDTLLKKSGGTFVRNFRGKPENSQEVYEHLLSLIPDLQSAVKKNNVPHFFIRFGFIQGALWAIGDYSVEELKEHLSGKTR